MKPVTPYTILHVLLHQASDMQHAGYQPGVASYIVLWWQEIALGHFYVEAGDQLDDATWQQCLLSSLQKTISFYREIAAPVKAEGIQGSQLNDVSALLRQLPALLSGFIAPAVPSHVDVSIVICTRNRSSSLKKCLESIFAQQCAAKEVIVVDNAPNDDSTREAVAGFPGATYIREMRPGLDIARNTGAKSASCAIIAYTDDDVAVHRLWTYEVWKTFQLPGVQAMTGLILATSLQAESQQIFEQFWGFNKGYTDIHFDEAFLRTGKGVPRVWEIGAGANMAYLKTALLEAGLFDERLDVGAAGCSGDSEIWYRMLLKGFAIHYSPRAIVFHEHRSDLKALHKQLFSYMRGHAAAALVQHSYSPAAGYKKYIYKYLLQYYFQLLRVGFPFYQFRFQTLKAEIRGIFSGIRFFNKNKSRPSLTND